MSDLFNVVFAGQVAAGSDPAAVRANVAKLFKVTNEATLDKLFSGQRIAVKKAVPQADAMKLRALMKQAGAVASLEACDETGKPLAAAPSATPAAPAAPAAPAPAAAAPKPAPAAPAPAPRPAAPAAPTTAAVSAPPKPAAPAPTVAAKPAAASPAPAAPAQPAKPMTMAERIAAMAAADAAANAVKEGQAKAAAQATPGGKFDVAPVGSQLSQPDPNAPPPVQPDTSHLGVAKTAGGELLSAEERAKLAPAPVVVPDLGHIKVAPPNTEVLREEDRRVVVPVAVDISHLSMSAPNTEVLKEDEKRVVIPVEVDISGISVAPVGASLDEIKEVKVPVNPDTSKLKLA